jgi:DNA (cytosine-5)-methyltransferase 1
LNGQDAYTGRILPVAFDARHNDVLIYGDKTGTLDTDGSSIGVCVHEAPIAAIPYDLFQVTAPLNRQSRDERSPCHTLARDNAAHAAVVTATPAYDPCPTLTSRMQGSSGWSPYKEDAHLVAHAAVVQPVAFTENHEGRVYEHDYIGALNQGGGKPGMCYPAIRTGMSVRRLTPTECERLQGFPDGWTQIPWKGKSASECPDGPRYKALGNSMACNVMRWIGTRIAMVDAAGVGV